MRSPTRTPAFHNVEPATVDRRLDELNVHEKTV